MDVLLLVPLVDLPAQVADVHVHHIGFSDIIIAPHAREQRIAGKHDVFVFKQCLQQRKLLVGKRDLLALARNGVGCNVHQHAACGKYVPFLLPFSAALSQDHADARKQFLNRKGFCNIIVRAHVQPAYLIHDRITRGKHDDGHA